jgi:hypothetical protein
MFRRNFTSSTPKTEEQYFSEIGRFSRDLAALHCVSQEMEIFNDAFIKGDCLLSDV